MVHYAKGYYLSMVHYAKGYHLSMVHYAKGYHLSMVHYAKGYHLSMVHYAKRYHLSMVHWEKRYQGEDERNQAYLGTFEEECMLKPCEELVRELPNELQERVNNIGNRASRETVCQLLIDLCAFKPYSYEELASILQRSPKALKDKYLKPLRLANWIPEMINHPLQKYVAAPSMARSNTKKK